MDSKLSEWIKHSVERELYGNVTTDEALALLQKVYEEIKKIMKSTSHISLKAEYEKLIKQIRKVLDEYEEDYEDLLITQIKTISDNESKWVKNFMKELGKDFVIPAALLSVLRFSPIANQSNYQGIVKNSSDRIFKNIDSSLRTAYLTKENLKDVASRINNKQKKEEVNITTDTETFNTTLFNMTDYQMFKANKEKVMYSAILDSKTCSVCASYDKQIFSISDAVIPPLHERCRCELIPESLATDEIQTYNEWFEEQDEDVKKQILGKGRYELYSKGLVKINGFVNNGQKITLKELYKDINPENI